VAGESFTKAWQTHFLPFQAFHRSVHITQYAKRWEQNNPAGFYCRYFSKRHSVNIHVNSAKKETSSLSTAFIFSKHNMCKYLYEHNKIQQLRHKLNKFHSHVTNRNWIMCPWIKGVKIKSNSQYLVWPPAALSTAMHLLMDCTRFASSCCVCYPTLPPRHLQGPGHF
jgi:hypothetical protein